MLGGQGYGMFRFMRLHDSAERRLPEGVKIRSNFKHGYDQLSGMLIDISSLYSLLFNSYLQGEVVNIIEKSFQAVRKVNLKATRCSVIALAPALYLESIICEVEKSKLFDKVEHGFFHVEGIKGMCTSQICKTIKASNASKICSHNLSFRYYFHDIVSAHRNTDAHKYIFLDLCPIFIQNLNDVGWP